MNAENHASPSTAKELSALPEGETSTRFVALSRIRIANGMTAEVKQAFRERPHLVDNAAGYLPMEVISPLESPDEIWLLTFWSDADAFRNWHRSHQYHDSHKGIPKGLKLVPGETRIRHFEHICS